MPAWRRPSSFTKKRMSSSVKKDPAKAMQKYKEMSELLDKISKELANPAVKIEEARREQLVYYIGTMEKYAGLGQADLEYRAGNFARVLEPALTGKIAGGLIKEFDKVRPPFWGPNLAGFYRTAAGTGAVARGLRLCRRPT